MGRGVSTPTRGFLAPRPSRVEDVDLEAALDDTHFIDPLAEPEDGPGREQLLVLHARREGVVDHLEADVALLEGPKLALTPK